MLPFAFLFVYVIVGLVVGARAAVEFSRIDPNADGFFEYACVGFIFFAVLLIWPVAAVFFIFGLVGKWLAGTARQA